MSAYRAYSGILLGILMILGTTISVEAQERFIDNGDGTVTDTNLGLMWAQTDNQADIFWKQAPTWIKGDFPNRIGPRFQDWRLPTIKELNSLYVESANYNGYRAKCGHMVRMAPPINISCVLIWSSDNALGLPLVFNYRLGSAFTVNLTDRKGCRVLPVRQIK